MLNSVVRRDKRGIALTGVIVLLFILSLMGTSMYAYSMNSLRSVRFLSDRKKAEYLAQAGVESVAYAYQLAENEGSNANAVNFLVKSGAEGAEATTNDVYMIYDNETQSYKFTTEDKLDGFADKIVIGYYKVTVTNVEIESEGKAYIEDSDNGTGGKVESEKDIKLTDKRKVFTSVGHTYGSTATYTKSGYISDSIQALGLYYDMTTGIIDGQNNTNFINIGTYTSVDKIAIKMHHITIPDISIGQRVLPIMMGYTAGNMILGQPESEAITLKQNQDNIVTFLGINDLFVNANVDVTPSKTNFNTLLLKGNNIVINGDIEIYAYGFTRSTGSSMWDNIKNSFGAIGSAIAGDYRMGTVIIGTPAAENSTVTDPLKGSTIYNYDKQCGRVYFGGDVFVNIQMPNVGTYRYKAFSAGTAYYFDDDIDVGTGENKTTSYGIDLFKYFLDYSIANKSYSKNVLKRFEDVIDIYYGSTGSSITYVTGDGNGNVTKNAMRKIDRDEFPSVDTYQSLIPPDETDGSALMWLS